MGLRPGETIGVIAPASPMLPERLVAGVDYLRRRGYRVVLGEHINRQRGYLAGDDEQRAADLMRMFQDPEVKAIFSARGGYGTQRILHLLDYDLIARNPKVLVGYSDLTALQLAIWARTGLVTYSGPMVAVEMGKGIDRFTEEAFWRCVEGDGSLDVFPMPGGTSMQVLRPGRARGPILGGCLSVLPTVLGTPYQPSFEGCILVLEDIGEEPYRLDRYLAHLKQAGVLDQVAGIVLGQFIDCEPSSRETPSLSLEELFEDYFGRLSVPVVAGFPYGHGDVKITLPLGVEAELDADAGVVRLLEPTVRQRVA